MMRRASVLWWGILVWAGAAWPQWGPPTNLRNVPFEAATAGWPGVTVLQVEDPGDAAEVEARLRAASVHRAAGGDALPNWFRFLQQHGVVKPGARPWSARTVVLQTRQGPVLPNLNRLRRSRQTPPGQGGELELVPDASWSNPQRQELQAFLDAMQPILTRIYGPPAFPNRVTIHHDPDLTNPTGFDTAVYNVSTKEIRLRLLNDEPGGVPQLTPFDPDDFYILTYTLLLAYHDELRFAYSAWEEGFARAAQLVAIFELEPDFDLRDPGYVLPIYEGLNQSTLGVPTFDLTNTSPLLRQVRGGMAQAAWFKVYAENQDFFAQFNELYYAQYDPGDSVPLGGDTVRLRAIAGSVAPGVEGLVFDDWFRRQFILDSSLRVGPKLYTFHSPQNRTAVLIIYYFVTLQDAGEAALTGTVNLRYLAWDGFDLSQVPEEGNQVEIGNFGDPGIANIAPTFFNIGGDQRILIEVNIQGHQSRLLFPYFDLDDNQDIGDLFGVVSEGDEGTLSVEVQGLAAFDVPVMQGVFAADVQGGLLTANQIGFTFQPADSSGPESTARRNTGLFFYIPLLTTSVRAPQTVEHTFPAGTFMMGFPVQVPQQYAPQLLSLDSGQVRLARWDPEIDGEGRYRFFPDILPLQPGLGYWMKTEAALPVSVEGNRVPVEDDFRLRLPQGWNQIANPFRDFAISVQDFKVQWKDEGPLSWEEAVLSGWVAAPVWGYDAGEGYQATGRLEPWSGYWLRVYPPEGVTVFMSPTAAQGRGRSAVTDAPGWRVQLIAETGSRRDAANFLGMEAGAAQGWDVRDWPQPPEPDGFVALGFAQEGWGRHAGLYAADVRPPERESTWTVEVMSDQAGEPVVIRWEGIRSLPGEAALYWEDPESGRRWSMRQVTSIILPGLDQPRPRRFRIRLEPRSLRPLTIRGLSAEPSRSGGPLGIRFDLSQPARLWVGIHRVTGQQVRELAGGQSRSAGGQRWSWDRRDEAGRVLPPGMYLVEVRALDEDGREVRATAAVRLP